ncbi:MAG: hypothetical protein QM804_16505 [Propionicimonas sp.]
MFGGLRGLCVGLLATAVTLLPAAQPTAAAAVTLPKSTLTCSGVWVVVELSASEQTVRCATDTRDGLAALRSAGFTLTTKGYLCAIQDYPADCEAAWKKGHYWSYWRAKLNPDGSWGSWTYATTGPAQSKPKAGYAEGWRFLSGSQSAPSIKPPKQYTKSATPKLSGTAKVGKKLKVKVGKWSPKPAFSYRWYRSGKAIAGATKSSYKLTKADQGKRITVKVTGKRAGWETLTKTSKQTSKVKK